MNDAYIHEVQRVNSVEFLACSDSTSVSHAYVNVMYVRNGCSAAHTVA